MMQSESNVKKNDKGFAQALKELVENLHKDVSMIDKKSAEKISILLERADDFTLFILLSPNEDRASKIYKNLLGYIKNQREGIEDIQKNISIPENTPEEQIEWIEKYFKEVIDILKKWEVDLGTEMADLRKKEDSFLFLIVGFIASAISIVCANPLITFFCVLAFVATCIFCVIKGYAPFNVSAESLHVVIKSRLPSIFEIIPRVTSNALARNARALAEQNNASKTSSVPQTSAPVQFSQDPPQTAEQEPESQGCKNKV